MKLAISLVLFLARDSIMLSALCYRPSVRLSVCHTGGLDQSKTVEVRTMKSPMPLVFAG